MDDIISSLYKKADDLKKAKKFEEALKFIDEANTIKTEEKSPDFWYKKGIRFCDFGEYEEALECFDKDLTLRQKNYATFFAKGRVLLHLKKYEESVECFNKAAEEHHARYLQNRKKAEHLKKAHKYEKVILYTDKTFHEKPLDDVFWYYKGAALLGLKKYDAASACLIKSLGMNKDNHNSLYDLAKCELFTGNEKKCLDILEQSCNLNPVNKEKLRVDGDFAPLWNNRQFRLIIGL